MRLAIPSTIRHEAKSGNRLAGRDIVCFSHDWGGDPLSKTHFMRLLARDNRVLWVNSIGYRAPSATRADLGRACRKLAATLAPLGNPEPGLFVLNPLVIPAYGRPFVRSLNSRLLRYQVRRAMRRLAFRRPINWVFNPAAAVVAGALDEEMLIYHCVDEYAAFSGVSREGLEALEAKLLKTADLVIVSSEHLYRSKSSTNSHTVLVRHGVDHAHFRRALDPSTDVPPEIAGLPRPVLGYFGLLGNDWIDEALLVRVARHFRGGSLVLLGKLAMDLSALARLPNVHLLGRKPYESLPDYCKGFDVALIPFPVSEVTRNANPLKAREYLAAGLPVISTSVPEVEALGLCRVAGSAAEFVQSIEDALHDPGPSPARSDSVREQSWEARLEEIRGHVAALRNAAGRRKEAVSA
jgi:glycosyltransferase involved in cell wall biosynthesis